MLSRRLIRAFSQYKSPQKFYDFQKPAINTPQDNISLDSMNKKALTFRKVELKDYDFVTEESDFDTNRFSLKSYLYTCIFYKERTFTVFSVFLLSWMIFTFISKILLFLIQRYTLSLSVVGYFGMTEPAFREIELERKRQRIKFSVLHSFD